MKSVKLNQPWAFLWAVKELIHVRGQENLEELGLGKYERELPAYFQEQVLG